MSSVTKNQHLRKPRPCKPERGRAGGVDRASQEGPLEAAGVDWASQEGPLRQADDLDLLGRNRRNSGSLATGVTQSEPRLGVDGVTFPCSLHFMKSDNCERSDMECLSCVPESPGLICGTSKEDVNK